MASAARYYQVGVVSLGMESVLDEALEDFDRLYDGFRSPRPIPRALRFEVVRHRPRPWSSPAYVVRSGGQDYVAGPDLVAVMPELEAAVNHQVVLACTRFIEFHAAVMAHRGRGVLFAADSGTGKTTLAAALITRGWKYLSDEFALVDPHSLRVHPFPKALCIKQRGQEMIKAMGLPLDCGRGFSKRSKYPVGYVSPHSARRDCVGADCPVSHILFLTRRPGEPVRLKRLPAPEAALHIYRIALNTRDLRRAGFDAAVALARQASCYEMSLGTLEESCALLEDLVTGVAPQAGTASREVGDCPPTTARHQEASGGTGLGTAEGCA